VQPNLPHVHDADPCGPLDYHDSHCLGCKLHFEIGLAGVSSFLHRTLCLKRGMRSVRRVFPLEHLTFGKKMTV